MKMAGAYDVDSAESVKWNQKAAEQGNGIAEYFMGWRYIKGIGVKQDDVCATQWLKKSADHNCAKGQLELARSYKNAKKTDLLMRF